MSILSKNLRLLQLLRPALVIRRAPRLLLAIIPLKYETPYGSNYKQTRTIYNKPPFQSILNKIIHLIRLTLRVIHLTWIWFRFAFRVLILRSNLSHSLLHSIEESGSIFVKLGQWASTRRDLFSPQLIQTLSKLQSNVQTSHPWSYAKDLLIKRFGSIHVFEYINPYPIGTGCCAQVYEGLLSSTKKRVAVKVLHPNIKDIFENDLFFLRKMSSFMEWLIPDLYWLSSGQFIQEFSESMMKQMDLTLEAKHLKKFIHNFKGDSTVIFPEPIEGMQFSDVLVEEFIEGSEISKFIHNPFIHRKGLAEKGIDMFLRMLFEHNFVHGDLHPGNILVTKDDQLVVLDPGIATALPKKDLKNFRSVFKAVIQGDGEMVGKLFLERSKHECKDPDKFVSEISHIIDNAIKNGELSLARVDVTKLLNSVFDTFRNHRVKLDSNFSMIIISIIVIEGLGKSLNPNLNLLDSAWPYFF